MEKSLKFRDKLVQLIKNGEKDLTWRLFDDKNLKQGDVVDLINWESGEKFGSAELIAVYEKAMSEINDSDFDGHETFKSEEEMYETYKTYYGDKVNPDTMVKIIRFKPDLS